MTEDQLREIAKKEKNHEVSAWCSHDKCDVKCNHWTVISMYTYEK